MRQQVFDACAPYPSRLFVPAVAGDRFVLSCLGTPAALDTDLLVIS